MFRLSRYPFYKQTEPMDCGVACLKMVCDKYGKNVPIELLKENCIVTNEGVNMLSLSEAAECIGLNTLGIHSSLELLYKVPLPCIVHWKQNHYIVVYAFCKNKKMFSRESSDNPDYVIVADPAIGIVKYSIDEFSHGWLLERGNNQKEGIALLLEPKSTFVKSNYDNDEYSLVNWLIKRLHPFRKRMSIILAGMIVAALLQLLLPLLTQEMVDKGIGDRNINYVLLILIAQLTLHISKTIIDFIRDRLLLQVSTKMYIFLVKDFLDKLFRLPISFFERTSIGNVMQRIGDHETIRNFLAVSTLNALFSLISMSVFMVVLAMYSFNLLCLFIAASILYVCWIVVFTKRRKIIDNNRFIQLSTEKSTLYQMLTGVSEIKMSCSEKNRLLEWEKVQSKIYDVSKDGLLLSQVQRTGAIFINETKNIILTFFTAKAVINGQMTLGMMMSVSYILGQLNTPLIHIIQFLQSAQDSKFSLERIMSVYRKKDESDNSTPTINHLPQCLDITIKNLVFTYDVRQSPVLNGISFIIPAGKHVAIVGASGCGKTTLLKLLLGFYQPTAGEILIGDTPLENIDKSTWRSKCGAVLQDGTIFQDTIANNIALDGGQIDKDLLVESAHLANLDELISSKINGFNTKIHSDNEGVSQGQKQRILIARAVYKNPVFYFFDEPTNFLDNKNESIILNNLHFKLKGKTTVVVAHRLNTIRHADNIIVLKDGRIAEQGTHEELFEKKGVYYAMYNQ